MISIFCRGIFRIIAASSGLLVAFGLVYAMDAMASRLPITLLRELLMSVGFMLPWALLFCGGLDDLARITKRGWLFWAGSALILGFLYYLNRDTSLESLNKAGAPLLASVFAIQPHIFRRILLVYSLASVIAGLGGVFVLFLTAQSHIKGESFANWSIAACVLSFAIFSIGAGVLSIPRRVQDSD